MSVCVNPVLLVSKYIVFSVFISAQACLKKAGKVPFCMCVCLKSMWKNGVSEHFCVYVCVCVCLHVCVCVWVAGCAYASVHRLSLW